MSTPAPLTFCILSGYSTVTGEATVMSDTSPKTSDAINVDSATATIAVTTTGTAGAADTDVTTNTIRTKPVGTARATVATVSQ